MNLLKYSKFINEGNETNNVWIGVNTLEEALDLYKIIIDLEYTLSDFFEKEMIVNYFDTYDFSYDSSIIFVFDIFLNNKKFTFRGMSKDNFDIFRRNNKAYLYSDNKNEIKFKLGYKPSYKPKSFLYENNKLNKIDSFNNFMVNERLDGSVPFVISQRLEDLLKKIRHPISRKLIDMSADDDGYSNEATLIDLDEFIFDHFVYTVANKYDDAIRSETDVIDPNADKYKIYDFLKTNPEIYDKYPSTIRIGRLVNKLFPGEFSPSGVKNSIESFVDAVVTQRNKKFNKIEIINGEDIVKYYNKDNYHKDAFNGSELDNSCMRYGSCSDYIQFYADNPDVQLVILKKGNRDKIVARALLWKIQYETGEDKKEGFFLDRIYFTKRYQKNLFIEYAKKNEWFFKKQQNSSKDTEIFDPTLNFYTKIELKTVPTFKKSSTGEYPYMDTMKWFYVERGFLSNSIKFKEGDETVYFLEYTDGRYTTEESGVYVSYYDDYINEDDLVYCEYGDEMRLMDDAIYLPDEDAFATEEYAEKNCIFDENGYCILKEKSVPYVDVNNKIKYTSKKYALDNFFYSDLDNKFYELADYSEKYNTYIPSNKSVEVYLNNDISKILKGRNVETDYYIRGDGNYFEYKLKNNRRRRKPLYFSDDVADDFVLVTTDLNLDDKEYYHKKYDRDKYGILNGEYVTKEILEKEKGK
jgi:hypothetical protein